MANQKLVSVPQLKGSVTAWFHRLLLTATSFLGYLIFPLNVAGISFGEHYRWVFQITVLMLPLSWTILRAQTVVASRIKSTLASFKHVLDAVNVKTLRYEGYNLDDSVLQNMIEAGWLEEPSTESDDSNPPITKYIYKVTERAKPYFFYYRGSKIKNTHEQTR